MKVIFLDRDGVINTFPGRGNYVTGARSFSFLPGSIEAVKKFNEHGFKVFVVSNQSGVAKGIYSQKDLDAIDKKMRSGLKKKKAFLDGIYYCTHGSGEGCSCRKPKTGMLEAALKDSKGSLERSFFIGDSFVDIETAKNFGAHPVLVLSGREKLSGSGDWPCQPEYVFDNLLLASYYLCAHYGR